MNNLKKKDGTFRKHMEVLNFLMKKLRDYKLNDKIEISDIEIKVIGTILKKEVNRENYISNILDYVQIELPRKLNMLNEENKKIIMEEIKNYE